MLVNYFKQLQNFIAPVALIGIGYAVPELTDTTFFQTIQASEKPLVVKFYNPNCPHCQTYAPIFEQVATSNTKGVASYQINVVTNPKTEAAFSTYYGFPYFRKLMGCPSTLCFIHGVENSRITGLVDQSALTAFMSDCAQANHTS